MTNEQAGKIFKTVLGQLIKNDVPESSMAYSMYSRTLEYREKKKMAANKRWREHFNQEMATTPQSCEESTDGPRQAENGEAVATSPSRWGSAADSYAHDALDSLDDKASDPAASNTGITPPVVSRESGNLEASNTANVQPSYGPEEGILDEARERPNCGADAVNRKTTVDRKSSTSAPQQRRRNPPPQCVIDAQKKAAARKAAAQSGKRIKPSRPKDREDFKQFVFEANLHIAIAEDWYAIHDKRGWKFQDGTPIKDWRAALTAYVHSREKSNK